MYNFWRVKFSYNLNLSSMFPVNFKKTRILFPEILVLESVTLNYQIVWTEPNLFLYPAKYQPKLIQLLNLKYVEHRL